MPNVLLHEDHSHHSGFMASSKRRNRRPGAAKNNRRQERLVDKNQTTGQGDIQNIKLKLPCQVFFLLLIPWCSFFVYLFALASALGVDLQSMLPLQWDTALEQWVSKVSPKLASPQLSMTFFLFQDAAFVCALAW